MMSVVMHYSDVLHHFSGSLGTSVFDMDAFLVGASGGVYALLAGHLANILLVSTLSNCTYLSTDT